MKPSERDQLLIELKESFGRIDERTLNIYHLEERSEQHLRELNGTLTNHAKQISSNKTSIKWIVRIFGAMIIVAGGSIGIINLIN